jgi:hypothetical protein
MDGMLESGAGRKAERIVALGAAAGAVAGLLVVAGIQIATVPVAAADKAYWTVSGPPCPTTTPAALARIGRPLAQVVDFGEGRFARVSGAVLCSDLADGVLGLVKGTACQFNRPRALAVWSKGGAAFFDLAAGQPATVTVSRTEPPRCVAAAHYAGD